MAAGFENNAYGRNYATGGGAGGGGGGFMNSQSPGGATKSASALSMRPVTVRQIINSEQSHTDGELTVDGLEVGHVTFVGIIRNLARNSTNISYNIEDGTGIVDVRAWVDNSSTALMSEEEYQTDHYVRVIGSIKNFNGRRTVNAGHIRLVTDFNEVFFHKLDAIHAHLLITRGGAPGGMKNSGEDVMKLDGGIYAQFSEPIQQAVMKVVHGERRGNPNDDQGVPISVIVRRANKFSESDVRKTIDDLIGEGVFFTGISDEHIVPTSNE